MKDDSLNALLSELRRLESREAVQGRLEEIAKANPDSVDIMWQSSFSRRAALPYVKGVAAPIGSLDYTGAFKRFKEFWDGLSSEHSKIRRNLS